MNFGDLLTDGIYAIQRVESQTRKKSIREIELELANSIKRRVSTIQWFRKGNVPTAKFEIEELARIIFNRGQMNVDWLEQFLKSARHPDWTAMRHELVTFVQGDEDQKRDTIYKRIKMSLNRQMSIQGITRTFREIEIQVTSDTPLNIIRHRTMNSCNVIHDYSFELDSSYRADGGNIQGKILMRNDHIYTSVIEFNPPLMQGTRASYSYTTSSRGSLSLTSEEVRQQYIAGTRANDFETWGLTMTAPTDELLMYLTFPPKYPISLPYTGGFGVYQGLNDVLNEKTRIIAADGFSARFDQDVEQWSLRLVVNNAKLGYHYALQWHPPLATFLQDLD